MHDGHFIHTASLSTLYCLEEVFIEAGSMEYCGILATNQFVITPGTSRLSDLLWLFQLDPYFGKYGHKYFYTRE